MLILFEADTRAGRRRPAVGRARRDPRIDLPIIFECSWEQVAHGPKDINENTKAYIGPWSVEVYKKIPKTVEHLYEEFPEKKIFRKEIELTTKNTEQYTKEIQAQGM